MGIPRITEGCCEAVEEEQPELFAMMTSVMCGLLAGDIEDDADLEAAGVQAGRSLLLVAFVWRAATAQLEAQQMEEE